MSLKIAHANNMTGEEKIGKNAIRNPELFKLETAHTTSIAKVSCRHDI
jgi:hypothetical protein